MAAATATNPAQTKLDFGVLGMTCAACVRRVEKSVRAVPGVADAQVDLVTHTATLTFDPASASLDAIAGAVEKAGYTPVRNDSRRCSRAPRCPSRASRC